jgi:hypothetical protein
VTLDAYSDWRRSQPHRSSENGRISIVEALIEHHAWLRLIAVWHGTKSNCGRCGGSGYDPDHTTAGDEGACSKCNGHGHDPDDDDPCGGLP